MTEAILPPPSGSRSINVRRPRSMAAHEAEQNVAGPSLRGMLWAPVALALVLASAILAWMFSQASLSSSLEAPYSSPPGEEAPSISNSKFASSARGISPVFSAEVLRWKTEIVRWADAFNLDPNLVATVMQIESCGHPSVRSFAGAIGLFQVMPYHFTAGENPEAPDTNAARGLAYLARGLAIADGRTDLALAGYNGGHGVIGRASSQWSAETQRFVAWGSGILADATAGAVPSPHLQAWLQAGGSSLCQRASTVQLSHTEAGLP